MYALYTRKHRQRSTWRLHATSNYARDLRDLELPLAEAMPHGEIAVYLVPDQPPPKAKFADDDIKPGELRYQASAIWIRHTSLHWLTVGIQPSDLATPSADAED